MIKTANPNDLVERVIGAIMPTIRYEKTARISSPNYASYDSPAFLSQSMPTTSIFRETHSERITLFRGRGVRVSPSKPNSQGPEPGLDFLKRLEWLIPTLDIDWT